VCQPRTSITKMSRSKHHERVGDKERVAMTRTRDTLAQMGGTGPP
jgi:hypothetical protein